ncbi:DEKNAAC105284 [Brettanomyces naardenensis]|uniref:DEKNAAC105284 n=1 Tax=Brettanomyces naardenensis TaxID=13370 RepID=A0A448YSK6_BRENA|nr:DEKNAAC105284 [Brettanomyces naardenensis]
MSNPVERLFSCVNSGHMAEALKYVDENCIFEAQGPSSVPIYGTYKGYEGVKRFFRTLSELFDTEKFEFRKWAEADDYVFAYGYMQHRVKKTDKVFKCEWSLVCRVEGGKIVSYKMFEDTAALQEAYGEDGGPAGGAR